MHHGFIIVTGVLGAHLRGMVHLHLAKGEEAKIRLRNNHYDDHRRDNRQVQPGPRPRFHPFRP